jgi:hypothetical protein
MARVDPVMAQGFIALRGISALSNSNSRNSRRHLQPVVDQRRKKLSPNVALSATLNIGSHLPISRFACRPIHRSRVAILLGRLKKGCILAVNWGIRNLFRTIKALKSDREEVNECV